MRSIKYLNKNCIYPKLERKYDLRFKLSIKQIKQIKILRKKGFIQQLLADKFGVCRATIQYYTDFEYYRIQKEKNKKSKSKENLQRRKEVRKIKGDKFLEYHAIYKRNWQYKLKVKNNKIKL